MKTRSFLPFFVLFLIPTFLFAQTVKKETIKVWGNCGMCKKVIESAAKKGGAQTAVWDTETKILSVSYNTKTSSATRIQQAVAKSGYDTQDFTGENEAYEKLPGCCHYERKPEGTSQETAAASTSVAAGKESSEDCKDMDCCKKNGKTMATKGKTMDCCSKDGKATASQCKEGKCDKKAGVCKDKAACKDKGCCAS